LSPSHYLVDIQPERIWPGATQ